MYRYKTFKFRINEEEGQILTSLAKKLQRNQSDAVRFIIRIVDERLNNGDKLIDVDEIVKSNKT